MDPSRCKVSYECTSVVRVDGFESKIKCEDFDFDGLYDGGSSDGILTFVADSNDYESMNYPPGVYTVTITGTAIKSINEIKETATFTLNILDPCDPPTSLSKAEFSDQEYTLTDDDAVKYTHSSFTISPLYCKFRYDYDISDLIDE